ncbi:hypothetical protein ACX80U_10215 [Arthrobacter sp. TmT3-37]
MLAVNVCAVLTSTKAQRTDRHYGVCPATRMRRSSHNLRARKHDDRPFIRVVRIVPEQDGVFGAPAVGEVISKGFVKLVTTVPASMSPISGSGGIVRASVGDAVGASVGDVGDGSSAVHAERPTDPSSPTDQIDVEAVVRRSTMT